MQRLLIAMSGGRCAYPGCDVDLIVGSKDDPRFIGQIAHIVSGKGRGPRPDPTLPREQINTIHNVLVLCPTHHAEVDRAESVWTPNELRRIKQEHEEAMQSARGWTHWKASYAALHYMNLPRLAALAALYGTPLQITSQDKLSHDHPDFLALVRDMGHVETVLGAIEPLAIPLDEIKTFATVVQGSFVAFNRGVRTKGIPWDVRAARAMNLTGRSLEDPHVYFNHGNFRVLLPIDPRFITTATAFSAFTSGSTMMAGLFQVKERGGRAKRRGIILGSPLVLGLQKPEGLEWFYE
jgi:hypothetical protein